MTDWGRELQQCDEPWIECGEGACAAGSCSRHGRTFQDPYLTGAAVAFGLIGMFEEIRLRDRPVCDFLLDHLTMTRCALQDGHIGPCSAE